VPGDQRQPPINVQEFLNWVELITGGRVVSCTELPRWRQGWYLDVDVDGDMVELYARRERGGDYEEPYPLEHEHRVLDLLNSQGVPVPRVWGFDASRRILLMERLRGVQGLAHATSDEEGRRLLTDYIDLLVACHNIPQATLSAAGLDVPAAERRAPGAVFEYFEARYLRLKRSPAPVEEFLRRWVHRNAPRPERNASFISYDAGQFMHYEGRITGLIDFELAHVGDPYCDLAALRFRDTMEPLGDLAIAFARYEELTGKAIEWDEVRYWEVAWGAITPLLWQPVSADVPPDTDLMTFMVWYVDNARYSLEVLAELYDIDLGPVDSGTPAPSPHHPSFRHLTALLALDRGRLPTSDLRRFGALQDVEGQTSGTASNGTVAVGETEDAGDMDAMAYRRRRAYRVARHLERVDEVGGQFAEDDIDDVAALTGRKFRNSHEAADALEEVIAQEDPARDRELVLLLHRRLQRLHLTLGPTDSLIVRHPHLQPLPDRRQLKP